MSTKEVICPECGAHIDIDSLFYKQIEERFRAERAEERKKLQAELEEARRQYKSHLEELKAKEEALKEEKERFDEALQKALKAQLRSERTKLEEELRKTLVEEQSEAMAKLQRELEAKQKQLAELNAAKIEIEQLKREKESAAQAAKLEAEKLLNERLRQEREKMQQLLEEAARQKQKALEEAQALKLKEKDEQIAQLKRAAEELRRKAEQGSMQMQGEALELSIESWLKRQFPFDSIEEVKKGAFGADCIQTVHTREASRCGIICIESKNAKHWSNEWINKLKQDMLNAGADIAVLVTTVYPPEMERMGWVEGVWVCSLEEFKGSISLLRESLVRIHRMVQREENKSDKMTLLYNYLTGNEFQMQLRAIVEGFIRMQEELEKEKRSLTAAWKRRQKLIDNVLANTTEMYGALQGIAGGGALPKIEALELPESVDEA